MESPQVPVRQSAGAAKWQGTNPVGRHAASRRSQWDVRMLCRKRVVRAHRAEAAATAKGADGVSDLGVRLLQG
jgi:hypothetical protein